MNVIRLPVIKPRDYQLSFWAAMDMGCKRAVKSWPRRAGKDITDYSFLIREAVKRAGTYYYYFPTLEDAKGALWNNIVEFWHRGEIVASGNMMDILCPAGVKIKKNESEHSLRVISKNGESLIKLGGTDNLKVIGMNGYGYVFSEWQGQKKEAFGFVSPILRENGGWALFNGTMRGKENHLYQDIMMNRDNPDFFSQWLRPEDTKEYYWVNEEEGINVNPDLIGATHPDTLRPYDNIQDRVEAGEISFALAKQEYLNEAVVIAYGTYYAYEMRNLTMNNRYLSIDPRGKEVYTFWDLGGIDSDSDSTSIVFAEVCPQSKSITIIDYYENKGHLRGHYIDYVKDKGYNYMGHYLPHDGKRRNAYNGENMADTGRTEYGMEFRFVPKTQNRINDIEICRRSFNKIRINSDTCEPLYMHLTRYHESEGTGKPCHKNSCRVCYGASHGADAFRIMVMALHHGIIEPYLRTKPLIVGRWWERGAEAGRTLVDDGIII